MFMSNPTGSSLGWFAWKRQFDNPKHAFEDALTLAGSPNPRDDRVCITSLCPRQFCMLLTATPPATTSAV